MVLCLGGDGGRTPPGSPHVSHVDPTTVADVDEGHVGDTSAKGENGGGEKQKGRGDTRGGMRRREEPERRGA